MRVLQIHNKYRHYGGEDAVVDNEFRLLKENGVEVEQLFFDNKDISVGGLFNNSKAYELVTEKVNAFQPDVVHVHNIFYNASPSVLRAAKAAAIPVVMTIHNYRLLCTGALFLRKGGACTKCKDLLFPLHGIRHKCFQDSLAKSTVLSTFIGWQKLIGTWHKQVDRFVVLTPYIRELFLDSSLKLPEEKVVVKPNSTDDVSGSYQGTERKGFVFVGRLSEEKGIATLVDAFNMIPQIELSVVGTGEMEEEMKKKAGNNIHFYGKRDKAFITEKLNSSKALVFPSIWYEGLPNTIIEAFSAGTPVVSSDMDNVNQLVTAGLNGEHFRANDAKSLAESISRFNNQDISEYMQNARRTFEMQYTHQKNFENLRELYDSLS